MDDEQFGVFGVDEDPDRPYITDELEEGEFFFYLEGPECRLTMMTVCKYNQMKLEAFLRQKYEEAD